MGKVYSPDEYVAGQIPNLAHFSALIRSLRAFVDHSDAILGGVLFGSALHNTHNFRSDVDCLLMFAEKDRENAQTLVRSWSQLAARHYIPVEPIFLEQQVAQQGLHNIEGSFLTHLQWCAAHGGRMKHSPLHWISRKGALPELVDDLRYMRHKHADLEKGTARFESLGQSRYTHLQKCLEAPVYVARKVLGLLKIRLPRDTKEEVIRAYRENMPEEMTALLRRVQEIDSAYTSGLTELRMLPEPNPEAYAKLLQLVEQAMIPSVRFVRLNLQYLNEREVA